LTMTGRSPQSGVCIIRFEPEPDRWLVSVLLIWPLTHDNRMSAREKVRHFSDPEEAITAIDERLRKAFASSRIRDVKLCISNPIQPSAQETRNSSPSDD
jgi:hypothetical protein